MSKRYNNGSHYENHERAAELHEIAAHAHLSAAQAHGKDVHLNGQELTRQALEHSQHAFRNTEQMHGNEIVENGVALFGHHEIEALAHSLWQSRGCPEGSADEDWFRASHQLRARAEVHPAQSPAMPQPLANPRAKSTK